MNYTADCPNCANEFPIAGPTTAEAGLLCPKCGTGFVPEKIHRVEPSSEDRLKQMEASARWQREQRAQSIETNAENLTFFSWALFVAAGVAVICGFSNESTAAYIVAGSLFSLALSILVVAQLVHIRAALERLNNK